MRFAVYFTPEAAHPLTQAAAAWLGRDAFTNASVQRTKVADFTAAEIESLTAEPARYGFHGTLVAPFSLRPERGAGDLRRAAEVFAADRPRFAIPQLAIQRIGHFFALVPAGPCPEIDALASDAVDHFEAFRAPLGEADIARRRPERLSERQRAYLARYGYPYVKEEFRFHMTLTGPVAEVEASRVADALDAAFARHLSAPLVVEAIALFTEPERGDPFVVRSLHPLAATEARKSA